VPGRRLIDTGGEKAKHRRTLSASTHVVSGVQSTIYKNRSRAPGVMRYACQTDAQVIPHPLWALEALHSGRWLTYAASQTWFKMLAASAALSCGKNRP